MRAFVIGTTSWDAVIDYPNFKSVFNAAGVFDSKQNPRKFYTQSGGSAINSRLAFQAIAQALGDHSTIYTCTKLGEDGKHNVNKGLVLREIDNTGMGDDTLMDAAFGQDGYTVPMNFIILNDNGAVVDPVKGRGILKKGDESVVSDSDTIKSEIETAVSKSDIVILHSRYPNLALYAAHAAKKYDIPVLFDCSETKPEIANELGPILELSDYVTAPADALAPGMTEPNADELFRRLRDVHQCQNFAISNNNDPIRVFTNGEEILVPVREVNAIDLLGAGDTRDAAMAVFLVQGESFRDALEKGSDIASLSIGYYGRKWVPHVQEHMTNSPLYQRYFPTSVPAPELAAA
jgi:ribokinase